MSQHDHIARDMRQSGAFLDGHFAYDNGKHGDTFFDSSVLVVDPVLMNKVASCLVGEFLAISHPHTIVATPHARELAQAVARRYIECGTFPPPRVVYAEAKGDGDYGFPFRFASHVEDRRVVVVDAVVNGEVRPHGVIAACRRLNANVIGLMAVADRGGWTAEDFGVRRYATILTIDKPQHEPPCELCIRGVELNGHFSAHALNRLV